MSQTKSPHMSHAVTRKFGTPAGPNIVLHIMNVDSFDTRDET
jgi:hypothetical protein